MSRAGTEFPSASQAPTESVAQPSSAPSVTPAVDTELPSASQAPTESVAQPSSAPSVATEQPVAIVPGEFLIATINAVTGLELT